MMFRKLAALTGLCFSSLFSVETGRLLVNLEPGVSFSTEEFADAASAYGVEVDPRNPSAVLQEIFLDHPFVVISSNWKGSALRRLAMTHGYRYLSFASESLEEAALQARTFLETIPQKSSQLPKLSDEESAAIYTLLQKIDQLFTDHQIRYWAGRSLLLGAVRHGGLLPWDNDLSLYIVDEDEPKLKEIEADLAELGVGLHYYHKDLYKLYPQNGLTIQNVYHPEETLAFRYPTVDLFVMTLERRWTLNNQPQQCYVHRSYDFYWWWGQDRFVYSQIQHLTRVPFGSFSLSIPGDPASYLSRLYGALEVPDLWKEYSLEPVWDHKLEKWPPTAGTALVQIDDFSPAPWTSAHEVD